MNSLTKKHCWNIIMEQEEIKPKIVAMRGRNPNNPSDGTAGSPTVQRLEVNKDGVSNTLTSVQKDNLLIVANTTKGFEEVNVGDSINLSVPNSKTRRGRVGKGVAQTLDTSCNQGIISHYGHKDKEPRTHPISPTLKAQSHGHEPMVSNNMRIRRLTEIECERLQGLPDNWTAMGNYDGKIKPISATQRYKMCGNGISVPVVKFIAERLFNINKTNQNI